MPKYLATYDLDRGQPEFMVASCAQGWTRLTIKGTKLFRMPETTIRGEFASLVAAKAAFDTATAAAEKALGRKITIERRIIVPYVVHDLVTNKTAPVDPRYVKATDLATCLEHQRQSVL